MIMTMRNFRKGFIKKKMNKQEYVPDPRGIEGARKKMERYLTTKKTYPEAHPCHRLIFLGEALLDLYMGKEIYGQDEKEIKKLREEITDLIEKEIK